MGRLSRHRGAWLAIVSIAVIGVAGCARGRTDRARPAETAEALTAAPRLGAYPRLVVERADVRAHGVPADAATLLPAEVRRGIVENGFFEMVLLGEAEGVDAGTHLRLRLVITEYRAPGRALTILTAGQATGRIAVTYSLADGVTGEALLQGTARAPLASRTRGDAAETPYDIVARRIVEAVEAHY